MIINLMRACINRGTEYLPGIQEVDTAAAIDFLNSGVGIEVKEKAIQADEENAQDNEKGTHASDAFHAINSLAMSLMEHKQQCITPHGILSTSFCCRDSLPGSGCTTATFSH